MVTLFRLLAGEVRRHLAALGARSLEEVIGRSDLLRPVDSDHPVARALDDLLVPFPGRAATRRFEPPAPLPARGGPGRSRGRPRRLRHAPPPGLPHLEHRPRVGARLAGIIAARHPAGLPEGSITIRLTGTAGQSLGAFLVPGVHLHLEGTANDGVGKGMAGGSIAIVPRAAGAGPSHGAGNAALYGATGGRLFVAGRVGLRFAVRNSGARAVVEGCLDHGCEYMTGGTVAILGPTGHNLAAGMTGGVLFVWDPTGEAPRRFAVTSPQAAHPSPSDLDELHALLQEHLTATASPTAAAVLGRLGPLAGAVLGDAPLARLARPPRAAGVVPRPALPESGHPNAPGGPVSPAPQGETTTAGGWRS